MYNLPSNRFPDNAVVILISSDFEAVPVIQCVAHMRNQGLRIALVSLEVGLTPSWYGVSMQPDYCISQIMPNKPRLLIVPGGNNCVSGLASSSQVHELIKETDKNDGRVAVLRSAAPMIQMKGLLKTVKPSRLLLQGDRDLNQFMACLINFAAYHPVH